MKIPSAAVPLRYTSNPAGQCAFAPNWVAAIRSLSESRGVRRTDAMSSMTSWRSQTSRRRIEKARCPGKALGKICDFVYGSSPVAGPDCLVDARQSDVGVAVVVVGRIDHVAKPSRACHRQSLRTHECALHLHQLSRSACLQCCRRRTRRARERRVARGVEARR